MEPERACKALSVADCGGLVRVEILGADVALPVPYLRRLDALAERTLYVARPGLRALPSGTLTFAAFAGLQIWGLIIFLWAIWWPTPRSTSDWGFAIGVTAVLAALVVLVAWLLLRRHPGFVVAVLRAPFIRLTVTDRRILWSLPWTRAPLMEIGQERVIGGLLGPVDARGAGSAAMLLAPGDPCADFDGAIHFDRLPDVACFVRSLGRA